MLSLSESAQEFGQNGASIQSFLDDSTFVRVLIGGRGSGKSRAVIADITEHIWLNAGAKAIVARETELSQSDSTIDSAWQYFETMGELYSGKCPLFKSWNNGRSFRLPSRLAVQTINKECAHMKRPIDVARWVAIHGDKLCGYIEFRGLPAAEKGKFRGMECSYLALVEADQIAQKQFALSMACLRWKGTDPETCDEKGFIKDRCVVLDTNPPGTTHWIKEMEDEEKKKPEAERTARFWHIDTSENEHNLPPNYIRDTILTPYARNPAMIQRMLHGQYADAYDGKAVFYAYDMNVHEGHSMPWLDGARMVTGMDVGTNNYSVICAHKTHKGHGYLWAMREIYLTESDTDRQCLELLKVLANEFPFWNQGLPVCPEAIFYCDPAARNSSYTKAGPTSSALRVIQSHGIYPGMKTAQHLQPTIATVNRLMQQNHTVDLANGEQKIIWHFQLNVTGCPLLANACRGEYRFPNKDEPGYGSDQPLKGSLCNHADHRCFVAGTLITTIRGDIPIEAVCVDDFVLTRNGWRQVTKQGMSSASAVVYALVAGNRFLMGTGGHPVWANGAWKPLASLVNGDALLSCDPYFKTNGIAVSDVLKVDMQEPVYNLTVEEDHEYFANGILVSNCDGLRYAIINTFDLAPETHSAAMTTKRQPTTNPEPARSI